MLQKKGWSGPNYCHLCLFDFEYADHIFIKCSFTRRVWEKITLALNFQSIWDGNELSDCFDTWAQRDCKHIHLPPLICWTIWLERNKTLFENVIPSTNVAAYKALGIFNTWKEAHTRKPRLPHIKKGPDLDGTPIDWFDGASLAIGTQSGESEIIKISPNTLYKWTFNCGPCTNTRANLLGAWATLFLASRLHIDVL